jgi:toxin-antitoxin system PIN domain toxin
MKSLDTNVLFYATNRTCAEHERALDFVRQALDEPADWIVADQVLLEYYRLLRNPLLLEKPLSAAAAAERIRWFREETGWRRCCWDRECWADTFAGISRSGFAARRTFDLALAVTLRRNGVKTLYTRNRSDFAGSGWFEVVDPLA